MKKLCSGVQYWKIVFAYTLVFCLLCATGCNGPALSSAEQVGEFEKAGPLTPEVDVSRLIKAKIHTGPYRVVSGDILELQMPAILRVISSDLPDSLQKVEPYLCRVSDAGTITLPIVGEMPVAGIKLAEVESSVVDAYFPKYVVKLPTVVCKVIEYYTENVTVVGAVAEPGLYPLRSDEMSLVALLMKAGGIVKDGASSITIRHHGRSGKQEELTNIDPAKVSNADGTNSEPMVLPVKGLNIPFADVALRAGDVVEVEKLNPQVFTVMGLVKSPNAFPYPLDVQYNLMQALAFAGGFDMVADPRYVKIYRQDTNGEVISATFRIDDKSLAYASNVVIKPGDVVYVDHTPRTRINQFLSNVFYIRAGVDLDAR